MIIINNQNAAESLKSRNIIVTILLSLFIIVDGYTVKSVLDSNPDNDQIDLSEKINYLYLILTIFDLVFRYYILKWQKWAFWGTVLISMLTFCLNLYIGREFIICLLGLPAVVLLFAALQLKSKNISGWRNLE